MGKAGLAALAALAALAGMSTSIGGNMQGGQFADAVRQGPQAEPQPTRAERAARLAMSAIQIGNGYLRRNRAPRGNARSWSVAQDRRQAKKARNVRRAKARAR